MKKDITREFRGNWICPENISTVMPLNVFHRQLDKKEINGVQPRNLHILYRKKFVLKRTEHTTIYITADDYYKLYINGRFVCQGPSPGYHFHYYYNVVDISDYVEPGENVIAVHTYYQGLINRVWQSGDDRYGFIMDLEQNNKVILSSDETFKCDIHSGFEQMGKIGYDTQFAERYISGSKHEGFEKIEYNDETWGNASLRKYADYELFEQPTKMLVFEDVIPKISYDESGVTLDFRAMYVGNLYAEAKGVRGDVVEILCGQELNDDGTVRWKMRANCDCRWEWQLSGGEDVLNQFDYSAFRYVRMNFSKGCTVSNIKLKARYYPFELQAKPTVEDADLLSVWDLCVRSVKYGVQEQVRDCMEREKGIYLGDGCYSAITHAYLSKDFTMYEQLIDDAMRSSVVNDGLMTCSACSFMQEIAEYPLMMYHSLLCYYKLSGNIEFLKKHHKQLVRILDFYKKSYGLENGLLCNLDKWCVVEWPHNYRDGYDADITEGKVCTDLHNVINAHYIGAIIEMNKICDIIGAEHYCNEKEIINSFVDTFYVKEKKLFKDNAETEHISLLSNVFPLMYDFCPDKGTEQAIVKLIREKGFTTSMLFGSYPILYGLRRIGETELMYECLRDEKAWLNMLKEGATTTFEGWSKESKWNTSLFHMTLSLAALFLGDMPF